MNKSGISCIFLMIFCDFYQRSVSLLGRRNPPAQKTNLPPPLDCHSCRSHCGSVLDLENTFCSCDNLCDFYHDCCPGVKPDCGELDIASNITYPSPRCKELKTEDIYRMVSSCDQRPEDCNVLDDDITSWIPVFERNTSVHFLNFKCASCNGVTDLVPWNVTLNCSMADSTIAKSDNTGTVSTEEISTLIDQIKQKHCSIYLSPDVNSRVRKCTRNNLLVAQNCSKDQTNEALKKACTEGHTNFVYSLRRGDTYKNRYCAECNKGGFVECGIGPRPVNPTERGPSVDLFSFNLLFDIDLRKGISVGKESSEVKIICRPGYIWIPQEEKCREQAIIKEDCRGGMIEDEPGDCVEESNTCAIGLILHDLEGCVPLREDREGNFPFDHVSNEDFINGLDPHQNNSNPTTSNPGRLFITFFANTSLASLNQTTFIKDITEEFSDIQLSVENLHDTSNGLVLNMSASRVSTKFVQVKQILQFLETHLQGHVHIVYLSATRLVAPSILNCTTVLYKHEEYEVLQNKYLSLKTIEKPIPPSKYIIQNVTAYVCVDTVIKATKKKSTGSYALGIATIVCMSLSIFALVLRLILQCKVPLADRVSSGMQISLVVSLLLAMFFYLLHPLMHRFVYACYTVAVLIHWSFLAAFTWMTMIAIDIYSMLTASHKLQIGGTSMMKYRLYHIVAWGIPTLIAGASIAIDQTKVPAQWQPFYGENICMISNRYALLLYFASPAALEFLINIILFVLCVRLLYISQTSSVAAKHATKERFMVHVKVVVLVGITWVFGFLAAPLNTDVLWFIFVLLNASQGVFLLATFLTSSHAKQHLFKKSRMQSEESNSTSSTVATSNGSATKNDVSGNQI